jgi:hypothetical protein
MAKTQSKDPPSTGAIPEKRLNISGLNRKEKRYVITKSFKQYGSSLTYNEKINALATRLQMAPNAVRLMGKRWAWNELELESQAVPAATATGATQVTILAPAAADLDRPFSTTDFVNGLKIFARTAIEAGNLFSNVTFKLIELYANRIESKIAECPEPDSYTLNELDYLYSRLSFYVNKSRSHTSPSAVASLLNSIRFGDNIPPPLDGVDQGVTVHKLQQTLIEMGVVSNPQSDTIGRSFDQYQDIPDISVK